MPELPEVETLARELREHIQGKTIKALKIIDYKKFRATLKLLAKRVIGKKIIGIQRRGKWLVLQLSSHYGFIIHLKMTGQLLYQVNQENHGPEFLGGHTMRSEQLVLPNPHTRVIFQFTDHSEFYFQDMRKFGYIELYNPAELKEYFIKKNLGIEPLERAFTFNYWHTKLKRRPNTTIKAVLLDQSVIAGIGNIYADESCFVAKIKPTRRVKTLTAVEQKALYQASKQVLRQAIRLGGTSFSDYYRIHGNLGRYWNKRKVYARTGQPCFSCGTLIKKTRTAGRGTHYCTNCQK